MSRSKRTGAEVGNLFMDRNFCREHLKPELRRKKLSVAAVARRIRKSPDTVRRLYYRGILAGQNLSARKTVIFEDSLESYLKSKGRGRARASTALPAQIGSVAAIQVQTDGGLHAAIPQ